MKALLVVMMVLLSQVAQAQSLEERIEKARQDRIATLQDEIAQLQESAKKTAAKYLRPIGKAVKHRRSEIRRLQNPRIPYEPELKRFTIGSFGRLPYHNAVTVDVIARSGSDGVIIEYKPEAITGDQRIRSLKIALGTAGEVDHAAAWADWARTLGAPDGKLLLKGVPMDKLAIGTYQMELPFLRSLWSLHFDIVGTENIDGESVPVLEMVR